MGPPKTNECPLINSGWKTTFMLKMVPLTRGTRQFLVEDFTRWAVTTDYFHGLICNPNKYRVITPVIRMYFRPSIGAKKPHV